MGHVKSFYKGEPLGKLPACAICGGAGEGPRAELRLGYGASVWLCAAHRSCAFLARRSGRDIVASLMHVWRAAGCLTRQRQLALGALQERLRAVRAPRRPGSCAWPTLRRECQARGARGEALEAIVADVARRFAGGEQRPPSRRTVQRWIAQRPPGAAEDGPGARR